jgi:hypothetical protein
LVLVCLGGFLFGVRMEALAPATGVVTARELEEIRALLGGLVEPGWFEGQLLQAGGKPLAVRLDRQGDGETEAAEGKALTVRSYVLEDGRRVRPEDLHFHRLRAGDLLWPGQVLAATRADDLRFRLRELESRDEESSALNQERNQRERAWLRHQLEQAALHVPAAHQVWLAVEVRVAPYQAVQAGDLIATIVPVAPETGRPEELLARLDVPEKYFGDVHAGQHVRLYCTMYNFRLHGCAEAVVERLEPAGEAVNGEERTFHAVAALVKTPFPLPIGATFKAEIVVGRKMVSRIILEH